MGQYTLILLAFVGGVFLAAHGGFNAQLSKLLEHPLLASFAAYLFSTAIALIGITVNYRTLPSVDQLKSVPYHLWYTGALFSVVGISLYYYTIPRLGIATMISIGLFGQIVFSLLAGHYGWFGMPVEPIAHKKIFGVLAMIIGIFLIKNA